MKRACKSFYKQVDDHKRVPSDLLKRNYRQMKKIIFTLLILSICFPVFAFQTDKIDEAKKLLTEKKYNDAIIILKKIVAEDEKNHEAYYLLGKSYLGIQEPEDAEDYLEEAVDLSEKNANYHFWLGQAYAMDAMNSSVFSQAFLASDILDEFKRTVELDPKHIPGRIGLINFYTVAPGIAGGDLEKAEENAKVLLTLDEMRGREALLKIYLKQEKIDSVNVQLKLLDDKIKEDKSFATFYNSLGYYYLGEEKIEEAIAAFKKQVDLLPNNPNSYDSLGDGYKAAGKYDEAIIQYKKALEINPEFSSSRKNLEELKELTKK